MLLTLSLGRDVVFYKILQLFDIKSIRLVFVIGGRALVVASRGHVLALLLLSLAVLLLSDKILNLLRECGEVIEVNLTHLVRTHLCGFLLAELSGRVLVHLIQQISLFLQLVEDHLLDISCLLQRVRGGRCWLLGLLLVELDALPYFLE